MDIVWGPLFCPSQVPNFIFHKETLRSKEERSLSKVTQSVVGTVVSAQTPSSRVQTRAQVTGL